MDMVTSWMRSSGEQLKAELGAVDLACIQDLSDKVKSEETKFVLTENEGSRVPICGCSVTLHLVQSIRAVARVLHLAVTWEEFSESAVSEIVDRYAGFLFYCPSVGATALSMYAAYHLHEREKTVALKCYEHEWRAVTNSKIRYARVPVFENSETQCMEFAVCFPPKNRSTTVQEWKDTFRGLNLCNLYQLVSQIDISDKCWERYQTFCQFVRQHVPDCVLEAYAMCSYDMFYFCNI